MDINCQQICKISSKKTSLKWKYSKKFYGGGYFFETPCTSSWRQPAMCCFWSPVFVCIFVCLLLCDIFVILLVTLRKKRLQLTYGSPDNYILYSWSTLWTTRSTGATSLVRLLSCKPSKISHRPKVAINHSGTGLTWSSSLTSLLLLCASIILKNNTLLYAKTRTFCCVYLAEIFGVRGENCTRSFTGTQSVLTL